MANITTTTHTKVSPHPYIPKTFSDPTGGVSAEAGTAMTTWLRNVVEYYQSNDLSTLTPEEIKLAKLMERSFNRSVPATVSVNKVFDKDENLIEHYRGLLRGRGPFEGESSIFSASFMSSPALVAYARKFYRNDVSQAAKRLGENLKYELADAAARDRPLPHVPFDTLMDNYLRLLVTQSKIPPNVDNAIALRKSQFDHLNLFRAVVNKMVEDIFTGSDYFYYNSLLNDTNKSLIAGLRNNMAHVTSSVKSLNIFQAMAVIATQSGRVPKQGIDIPELNNLTQRSNPLADEPPTHCQTQLTELAFQNEALRRTIFQEIK